MPERIQLSRRKSWRMPDYTVRVARPDKWGNPFRVCDFGIPDKAAAVQLYQEWLDGRVTGPERPTSFEELRGKNLACWCQPGTPCLADVLLEIANAPARVRKPVKRQALARSGGLCESIGEVYRLDAGQRCNTPLSNGVEFDHYPVPATDPGSDTLENCVASCKLCHRFKTSTYDVPMQAKGKRGSYNHNGIRPPSKWQTRQRHKAPPQRSATRPIVRRGDQI